MEKEVAYKIPKSNIRREFLIYSIQHTSCSGHRSDHFEGDNISCCVNTRIRPGSSGKTDFDRIVSIVLGDSSCPN